MLCLFTELKNMLPYGGFHNKFYLSYGTKVVVSEYQE